MAMILTEEQQDLKALVRDFMEGEVKPAMGKYDLSGEFPTELYEKGFEIGLLN